MKWAEAAKEGADEPEHPAPALKLAAAVTPVAATTPEATSSPDNLARWLGGGGLLAGLVGLAFGLRPRRAVAAAEK